MHSSHRQYAFRRRSGYGNFEPGWKTVADVKFHEKIKSWRIMTLKQASCVPGAHQLLRLTLVVSLLSRAACFVTIRNWTGSTSIMVTSHPNGSTEELKPNEWMQYTCTGNGRNGMFTVANYKDDNVATFLLNDGQILALVDNISDSIDGLIVDSKGNKISTLFINL